MIETATSTRVENREKLPYRQTATAIMFDQKGNFCLVQKKRYKRGQYEWSGGGCEQGENFEETAIREVEEELGLSKDKVNVLGVSETTNTYEWQESVTESVFKSTGIAYRGQSQHFVLARFNGKHSEVKLQSDEIKKVIWVPREKLRKYLKFPNQATTAEQVLYNPPYAGTEIYGLSSGVVEKEIVNISPEVKIDHAMVFDPAGMLRMLVTKEGQTLQDSITEYSLPRFFSKIDELRKRPPLRVFREPTSESEKTKGVLAEQLSGLDYWVWMTHPGFQVFTKIKLYEQYDSGKNQTGGSQNHIIIMFQHTTCLLALLRK